LEYIGPYIFFNLFINHQFNYYGKLYYINIFRWKIIIINFNLILMNLSLLFMKKKHQVIINHLFNNLSIIPNIYLNYYSKIVQFIMAFSQ
jgi:hypothetical protein